MRLQTLRVAAVGVFDLTTPLAASRAEQVAEDGESQADMCDPGWNELMLAMARRSVSCTRSSARSTLPLSEIANARKLGTAASMASRTAGEASSARSFVVRIVESPVVAPGRDSDAAILFMDDLRSRLANHVQATSEGTRRTLKLLTKRPWEMEISSMCWKLGKPPLRRLPVNEGPRQTFLYARKRTRTCTCRWAFSSHHGIGANVLILMVSEHTAQ